MSASIQQQENKSSADHQTPTEDYKSDATLEPAPSKQHPNLWFEDGSVVLRVQHTLFKVHMSLLSRHSKFFEDMFSVPHLEPQQGVVIDGIPIIDLYDAVEDVANLLAAIYDGPVFGNNDQDDFHMVSGILRLATKYTFDTLRSKALAHLSIAWPSDLKAWDAREDLARSHETDSFPTTRHRFPHPIAIINLAHEIDAPSLLPAAFYDLSRYPYSQILEPTEDDLSYWPLPPTQPNLLLLDLQRLCLGKEASQHAITTLITALGSSQSVRPAQLSNCRKRTSGSICVSAAACRKDFSELVNLATQHYLFDRERGFCDPLYVAEELGQLKSAEFSECKACARSLETWATRERERLWKSMPIWFRLDYAWNTPP